MQNEIKYDPTIRNFADVLKEKKGNTTAMNKLLCAILRHAGIKSDIIVVSTDRNKPLSKDTFFEDRMSRMAVRAIVGNMAYFMDAERKNIPFGYLQYNYYNGLTRVINKEGGWIELDPSLAIDYNETKVDILPKEDDPNQYTFSLEKKYGIYASIDARESHKDSALNLTFYQKFLKEFYPNFSFLNVKVILKYLDDIENRFVVTVQADVKIGENESVIFLDPFITKIYDGRNPFAEMKDREQDIELDYYTKRKYSFNFKANKGHTIEDFPTKKKIQFGDPAFITFRSWVKDDSKNGAITVNYESLNIPMAYSPEELEDLKMFFDDLMQTFNQKIMIKKN